MQVRWGPLRLRLASMMSHTALSPQQLPWRDGKRSDVAAATLHAPVRAPNLTVHGSVRIACSLLQFCITLFSWNLPPTPHSTRDVLSASSKPPAARGDFC